MIPYFLVGFFLTFYGSLILPGFKLFYFAPVIIRSFYLKSFTTSLWVSCFLGLFIDLLSSHVHFGMHAVNFTIASALLYSSKRHFFEDSLSTLPFLTGIYSLISSLLQIFLSGIFDHGIPFSWEFIKIDLLLLPFLDGVYAFLIFTLPFILFGKRQRKGTDYFLDI